MKPIRKYSKTKKKFLYNPKYPTKTFSIYNNNNPQDTIPIKYKTTQDVINTINTLEHLYITHQYTHKRISQVAMILKIRLELLKNIKPTQYHIAKQYSDFLKSRTTLNHNNRYKTTFKLKNYRSLSTIHK